MSSLDGIMPLWIVADLRRSCSFYLDDLGFELRVGLPEEEPFFAIVGRDGVGLMLKHISPGVPPMPNPGRHAWAKWDAFITVADPEALAEEITGRAPGLVLEVRDTEDGLRGFEVSDPDGYVLFFGRPLGRGDSSS